MSDSEYKEILSRIKTSKHFKKEMVKTMKEATEVMNKEFIETKSQRSAPAKKWIWVPAFSLMAVCSIWALTFFVPGMAQVFHQGPTVSDFASEYPKHNGMPMLTIDLNPGENFLSPALVPTETYPWREDIVLSSLPVFKNPAKLEHTENGDPFYSRGMSLFDMSKKAKSSALALGFTIESEEVYPSGLKESTGTENYYLELHCKEGLITVTPTGSVTIDFSTPLSLPDEYSVMPEAPSRTWEKKRLDLLIIQYKSFLDMQSPVAAGEGYYDPAMLHYTTSVEEGQGDVVDRLLAYQYDKCWFTFEKDLAGSGKQLLKSIDRAQIDLSQKLGDYPIISTQEARTMLCSGKFYSGLADTPKEEDIARVMIVYHSIYKSEMIVPYYLFLVNKKGAVSEDPAPYNCYWIPAVTSEYFYNQPDWEANPNAE